jgi:hypothetical protein
LKYSSVALAVVRKLPFGIENQTEINDMDLMMRFWAVVLILAGAPVFLGLSAALGVLASLPPPSNADDLVPKFILLYIGFAVAGLLTASGCVVWAIAKIAYPLKETSRKGNRSSSTSAA